MDTQLILVDGILGSGKTSLTRFIGRQIRKSGQSVHYYVENARPHPVFFGRTLRNWQQPWLDSPVSAYLEGSLGRWWQFVRNGGGNNAVLILDGFPFQTDFFNLFLMNAGADLLRGYAEGVLEAIQPLNPRVLHLYQEDIPAHLEALAGRHNTDWLRFQVEWRARSPYAQANRLHGVEGWVQLHEEFHALCDSILAGWSIPRLEIETSGADWEAARLRVLTWLNLPYKPPTKWQARLQGWTDTLYDWIS